MELHVPKSIGLMLKILSSLILERNSSKKIFEDQNFCINFFSKKLEKNFILRQNEVEKILIKKMVKKFFPTSNKNSRFC